MLVGRAKFGVCRSAGAERGPTVYWFEPRSHAPRGNETRFCRGKHRPTFGVGLNLVPTLRVVTRRDFVEASLDLQVINLALVGRQVFVGRQERSEARRFIGLNLVPTLGVVTRRDFVEASLDLRFLLVAIIVQQ